MRPITSLLIAIVLSISATSASADVTIVDDGFTHYAAGHLGAAETSGRLGAYIYCELYGASLYCGAYDGAGAGAFCSTSDPSHKKMFPMMGRSSTIQFFLDASGTCTRILVFSGTENLALVPVPGAMNFPTAPSIDSANRSASGSVNAPRTPNTNEAIGCEAMSFGQTYCGATDSTNKSISCYASRDSALQTLADQILAITAINQQSYVSFTWDNTSPLPTCTSVVVVNASYYLP